MADYLETHVLNYSMKELSIAPPGGFVVEVIGG